MAHQLVLVDPLSALVPDKESSTPLKRPRRDDPTDTDSDADAKTLEMPELERRLCFGDHAVGPIITVDGVAFVKLVARSQWIATALSVTARDVKLPCVGVIAALKDAVSACRKTTHGRLTWKVGSDGTPLPEIARVNVLGFALDVLTTPKPLAIKASRRNVQWLLTHLQDDANDDEDVPSWADRICLEYDISDVLPIQELTDLKVDHGVTFTPSRRAFRVSQSKVSTLLPVPQYFRLRSKLLKANRTDEILMQRDRAIGFRNDGIITELDHYRDDDGSQD